MRIPIIYKESWPENSWEPRTHYQGMFGNFYSADKKKYYFIELSNFLIGGIVVCFVVMIIAAMLNP